MSRLIKAAVAAIVLLVATTGCTVTSARNSALSDIAGAVGEIGDATSDEFAAITGAEPFALDVSVASDLRNLSEDQRRKLGSPIRGFYLVEQTADHIGVEFVVVGYANEGGFSNADKYYYTCFLIEGVPGIRGVEIVDRQCDEGIVRDYFLVGYEAVSLSQFDL